MRVGIVSDIHANLAAFQAVLADMGAVDTLWCLGDLVGYGPDPNECIALLRRHEHICIVGNHDQAAIGNLDISEFNAAAAISARWTSQALTPESLAYLQSLPERLVWGDFTLAHGSPREPVWEYILDESGAAAGFAYFDTGACLVGHTHCPALYRLSSVNRVTGTTPGAGDCFILGDDRIIANPGGVGQPRDGDPRAAYALLDTQSRVLEWRRVAYPIQTTQDRMREAALPQSLIDRLAYGW